MKSISKFACTLALTLVAFNLTSVFASAEDGQGRFTLTHDVRWQKALVPAGDYVFSLESRGPSELLMLRKVSGSRAGFILLANATEMAKVAGINQLIVKATDNESYVSEMELPIYGLTLRFSVPKEEMETQVARASSMPAASSAR